MWVFFEHGFLSVVQKKGDKKLCVRARCKDDLDIFRRLHCPTLTATQATKLADYPYRAWVGRRALANAMASIAESITYDNFKSAVAKACGFAREATYHQVWSTLHALEVKPAPTARSLPFRDIKDDEAEAGFDLLDPWNAPPRQRPPTRPSFAWPLPPQED